MTIERQGPPRRRTSRLTARHPGASVALAVFVVSVILTACTGSTDPTIPVSLPEPTSPTTTAPTTTSTTTTEGTDPSSTTSTTIGGPIVIQASDDASAIVEAAPEGTAFVFAAGIHRGFEVEPKDGMEFRGEPGAVLSGAIVLDGAEDLGDGRWRVTGIERTGRDHGSCIDDAVACGYTQDVFIDDVMLWQVSRADLLESGAWYWGDDGIYLADDPAGRRVELSVQGHAFRSAADDVVIEDLVVEKYATMAQEGAIQAQESGNGERGVGWLIEDVDVSGVHGAGIRTGDATIVRNVRSHHNGQMGISVSGGTDVLLEGNEFDHNNVAGFAWGWEAGGSKFTRTTNLVVRDNHAHHNNGPGLWTDIANVDTLYEGNLAEANTGPGIFHEISYEAIIRDNVVLDNGSDNDGWLWGAGIVIAASEGVDVIGNEVRGNANAIAGVQQERGDGPRGPYRLDRLKVTGNVVEIGTGMTGVVEDVGDPSVFDRDLVFEGNVYVGPVGESYAWMGRILDRSGWQAVGQDVNGTWR